MLGVMPAALPRKREEIRSAYTHARAGSMHFEDITFERVAH
jgi:hypothetical protein